MLTLFAAFVFSRVTDDRRRGHQVDFRAALKETVAKLIKTGRLKSSTTRLNIKIGGDGRVLARTRSNIVVAFSLLNLGRGVHKQRNIHTVCIIEGTKTLFFFFFLFFSFFSCYVKFRIR